MRILLNGNAVLDLELNASVWGRPTATAELEADVTLADGDDAELEFEDGTTYTMTVARVQPGVGWLRAALVGGQGALERVLEPRFYEGVTARTVIADIVSDAGEVAGDLDAPALLTRWARSQDTAIAALERVVQVANRAWRVQRDGRIWVGTHTWPERSEPLLATTMNADLRRAELELTPDLEPGESLELIAAGEPVPNLRLERVRHTAHDGAFRTWVGWR
jgi:hypothetical protein